MAPTNFNIVCSVLGGFIAIFGLVSYLLKERFYLSEALVALIAGIFFSHVTKVIKPIDYVLGSQENLATVTLCFTRLVLGIQLVIAGVQLPKRHLLREWKALIVLVLPVMTVTWLCTSLIIWGLVPGVQILHALAIGACVTPTDPVLSNSIVKGKFADQNVPERLQKLIVAESGINDGFGYPFLFLPLYLLRHSGKHEMDQPHGLLTVLGRWFVETWVYMIGLGIIYGISIGWLAKELLHRAETRGYVDRESFLVFVISLALLTLGTCGLLESDDILACFIAGNAFTFDDWFRLRTLDDSLQPTIDMLLNLAVFMWLGAVCPWSSFVDSNIVSIYRLILLAVLVLLFKRLPVIYAMRSFIPHIEQPRQALFVGFFGPIGVSAIFYLYVSVEYLRDSTVSEREGADAKNLEEKMLVIVWFLVISSIVVHGLCISLAKLGILLPRALSSRFPIQSRQPLGSQQHIQSYNTFNCGIPVNKPHQSNSSGSLRDRHIAGED
ncbi:Na/H antiporter [Lepidopterella palustris CBS 459.81]|uniref:Na/H antiporter n=1 Tax=Lepidopterella palustris CBS 459.81 TaxID=1314670 RepID=A0A8E2DZP5_9PEZI|nr:Na/H antiporter [Lepidopterella palustris CBS 459.81]